jgi:hypothetical protein
MDKPEHTPKPQKKTNAAFAHDIEDSKGGLEPIQKHIGTTPAFGKK